jgi:ABC-type glycerol-3-phosphate transport system permease component
LAHRPHRTRERSAGRKYGAGTKRWIDWAIIATMAVLAIGVLLPFLWLFSMSFRPVSDVYKLPPTFLPQLLGSAQIARAVPAHLHKLDADRAGANNVWHSAYLA